MASEFESIKLKSCYVPLSRVKHKTNYTKFIHKSSKKRKCLRDSFPCPDNMNVDHSFSAEYNKSTTQKDSAGCNIASKEAYVCDTHKNLGNVPSIMLRDIVVHVPKLKSEIFLKKCTVPLPTLQLNSKGAFDPTSSAYFEVETSEKSSYDFKNRPHQKFKSQLNRSNNNSNEEHSNSSSDTESYLSENSSVIDISLQCLANDVNKKLHKTSSLNTARFDSDSDDDSLGGFSKRMNHVIVAEIHDVNENIHNAKKLNWKKFESAYGSDSDLSENLEKENHSLTIDPRVTSETTLKECSVVLESLPINSFIDNLPDFSNKMSCVTSKNGGVSVTMHKRISNASSESNFGEENVVGFSKGVNYRTPQATYVNGKKHKRKRFKSVSDDKSLVGFSKKMNYITAKVSDGNSKIQMKKKKKREKEKSNEVMFESDSDDESLAGFSKRLGCIAAQANSVSGKTHKKNFESDSDGESLAGFSKRLSYITDQVKGANKTHKRRFESDSDEDSLVGFTKMTSHKTCTQGNAKTCKVGESTMAGFESATISDSYPVDSLRIAIKKCSVVLESLPR